MAADTGFRLIPHTADLALEAWAPGRSECIAQAVCALVASFADVDALRAGDPFTYGVEPGPDEEVLLQALEEVIYLLDVRGAVPIEVVARDRQDGGLQVDGSLAPIADEDVIGALPKAVSRHELRIAPAERGWRCHVVVDV